MLHICPSLALKEREKWKRNREKRDTETQVNSGSQNKLHMYISILKENQSNETTKNEIEDKTREGNRQRQMEKKLRQGREEGERV